MKPCVVFFLFLSFQSYCQDLFTISLEKFTLSNTGSSFTISEIIDARQDKRVIGIIQRGLSNRKDLAVFTKPGLREVEDLIDRSGLFSKEKGLVLRISKLSISEITEAWKETAKAELSVDLFIPYENNYYYITSVYTTSEPKGMDVTNRHPSNIVAVLESAIVQLSSHNKEIKSDQSFTLEELTNPKLSFRNIANMPIVKASKYKDGYYATFNEFVNNEPSIDIECLVQLGQSPMIKCGGKEKSTSLYGYAKDNKLYILFHHEFYPLEKDNDSFTFQGPREMSNKDVNNSYRSALVPRQIGDKQGHRAIYMIDLNTGSILNTTGF